MNPLKIRSFFVGLFFVFGFSILCSNVVSAATFDQSGCNPVTYYDVGPGKQYTRLSQLPWSQLKGCDTVRVWPNILNGQIVPYYEQVLISAGTNLTPTTPNKWFRLQGMKDANGNRPILDRANSTQKETVNGQVRSLQYPDNNNPQWRALYKEGEIILWSQAGAKWGSDTPQNIMIDGFEIRGASDLYTFTDEKNQVTAQTDDFASGIYGFGHHLIFKDNLITDNGNGIFINSRYDDFANTSRDLLIEGNIFTNNGRIGDFHEHHIYVQAIGEIVQGNFFGMGRPGSHPQAYKTRSSDSVFRYNTVILDPAQTNDTCLQTKKMCGIQQALWYSEPDGSPVPIKAASNYNKAFVYGNIFVDKANGQGLLFTDRDAASTVYFFNNTVFVKREPTHEVLLFMNPIGTKIEARNNIFAAEPLVAGGKQVLLVFEGSSSGGGNVNLVNNLVTTPNTEFWPNHHGAGANTTVTGMASNILIPNNNNSLLFADLTNLDFHLKAGSLAIGASAALDPIAIANGHVIDKEYVSLGATQARATVADAGAFAFTGQGGAVVIPPSTPPATPSVGAVPPVIIPPPVVNNGNIVDGGNGGVSNPLLDFLKQISLSVGSLVKAPDDGNPLTQLDSTVYYIGSDGKRHVFPNPSVYFTWFADFSTVQTVSLNTLAKIPLGRNVIHKPGVKMVKFLTNPRVYVVDIGGVLRSVRSEAVASALYGSSWNKKILDISDAYFTDYTFSPSDVLMSSDFHLADILLNVKNIDSVLKN